MARKEVSWTNTVKDLDEAWAFVQEVVTGLDRPVITIEESADVPRTYDGSALRQSFAVHVSGVDRWA